MRNRWLCSSRSLPATGCHSRERTPARPRPPRDHIWRAARCRCERDRRNDVTTISRRELTALAGLFALGCAVLAFSAVAPWIVRTQGYATFIPAVAASGFLAIAATRLSAAVPA